MKPTSSWQTNKSETNKAFVADNANLRVDQTYDAMGIDEIVAVDEIVETAADRDETNANDSKWGRWW